MQRKTIWMLLSVIGTLGSLSLKSCGRETIEEVYIKSYVYSNNTEHSIKIKKWLDGEMLTYDLQKSGKIEFRNEFNGGGCLIDNVVQTSFSPNSDCLLIISDSLEIVFDGSRSYVLKPSDNIETNILREANYEHDRKRNKEDFRYSFTEKDYMKAN